MTKPKTLQGCRALLVRKREREAERRTQVQAAERDREARKQERDQIKEKLAEIPEVESDADISERRADASSVERIPMKAATVVALIALIGVGPIAALVAGTAAKLGLQSLLIAIRGIEVRYANTDNIPVIACPPHAVAALSTVIAGIAFFPVPGLPIQSFFAAPFAALPAGLMFLASYIFGRLLLIQAWAPVQEDFRRRRTAYERAALKTQLELADERCEGVGR